MSADASGQEGEGLPLGAVMAAVTVHTAVAATATHIVRGGLDRTAEGWTHWVLVNRTTGQRHTTLTAGALFRCCATAL